MKSKFFSSIIVCIWLVPVAAHAEFDWGGDGKCSGDGTFKQQVLLKKTVIVGEIPIGKKDVYIKLSSKEDLDIQIYDKSSGAPIVGWNIGAIIGDNPNYNLSVDYYGMGIEYSGYNGDGTGLGNEYIRITGTLTRNLTMKVFGYRAGYATVNYSWNGTEGCSDFAENGAGSFEQPIQFMAEATVGEIPAGLSDVYISLNSDKDIDIRLYDVDGTQVVHWPDGILSGPYGQSAVYNGDGIEYSGYNGDGTGLGHEYIKLIGTTKNAYVMKVFGYKDGDAKVKYSWGSGLMFPFARNEVWQICQGYNNSYISHNGNLINSLDFAYGTDNLGKTGCAGAKNNSANKPLLAPGSGTIAWNGSSQRDITCLRLDRAVSNGHGDDVKSIKLGHLQNDELQNDELQNDELQNDELQNDELQNDKKRVESGAHVNKGDTVGVLCYPNSCDSDGGYAHIHMSVYTTNDCTGKSVPLGTIFGDGYDFSSDSSENQWFGTEIPAR